MTAIFGALIEWHHHRPPADDGFSSADLATIIIATIGALTGIGSLIYTMVSRHQDEGRLGVALRAGFVTDDGQSWSVDLSGAAQVTANQPLGTRVLVIEVQNTGHHARSIATWGIEIGPGFLMAPDHLGVNPDLSHRLGGHEAVN